ncbi:adenosylcobinamide-phosphate synthase CbiB [Bacteroides sp. 51]|uniref:adenosylcobinamide-phosphate synthase CbiB n=1 Tax=Bacteroides sp. 51 TaxID=2302938 RepID=UPI0013D2D9DA|nr:adenosylcobinamide-phosphate synthase CbiB [Bacteroides sp. 51]NDV82009.1 cobalamin biosynthesis protein CobD [Bacteroides sp. 51]
MACLVITTILYIVFPLLIGWVLDKIFGDPSRLPHPIVGFGKLIAWGEHRFNKGMHKVLKGGLWAGFLILMIFTLSALFLYGMASISFWLYLAISSILIFYCLAGTTLIREVRMVFQAVDRSLEEGRKQVGRIVGRDTSALSAQEVRTAALETLAENLSDGVIAPLFWYLLLGTPGMLAYKMINTLDSMIGYKNERYLLFGRIAAYIDDFANYIPARITAWLMVIVSGKWSLMQFVRKYGRQHASPNSGYPEAALAGILNCRFGGPHDYFGESVYKPYIGENERALTTRDMKKAMRVNQRTEIVMMLIIIAIQLSVCTIFLFLSPHHTVVLS